MDSETFPESLVESFDREVGSSPLKHYLGSSTDLKWVKKRFTIMDFKRKINEPAVKQRFLCNPNPECNDDCPSVYARFPGNLSIHQLEHCIPNYHILAPLHLTDSIFYPEDMILKKVCAVGTNPRLFWIDRCLTLRNDGFSGEFLAIIMAWLQRHSEAKIWTHLLTIIPITIMNDVSTMHSLFQQYNESQAEKKKQKKLNKKKESGTEDLESDESTNHMFHPEIDNKTFMEAAINVMSYILKNEAMFIKPYIAMLTQEEFSTAWACFISVNAVMIGSSEEEKVEKKKKCGYITFNPFAIDPDHPRPSHCSFFLKLAYLVLAGKKIGERNNDPVPPWNDEVIAPWFQTMDEFRMRFKNKNYNFGYVVNEKEKDDDTKNGNFVAMNLHNDYPLLSTTHESKTQSGIKAFIFLLDFCLSMTVGLEIKQRHGDVMSVFGIGNGLPTSSEQLNGYIQEMEVCIIQVIDRIASTQLGPSREEAYEYKEHILPKKMIISKEGESTDIGHSTEPFPDVAGYQGWKAMEKQPISEPVGDGDDVRSVEFPQLPRKPRRKKDGKDRTPPVLPKTQKGKPKGNKNQSVAGVPLSPKKPKRNGDNKKGKGDKNPTASTMKEPPPELGDVPCMENVAPLLKIFARNFREATSEESKDEVSWQVFKLVHYQSPLRNVAELMNMIRKGLEQGCDDVKITVVEESDLQELDLVPGSRCKKYLKYMDDRKMEFRNLTTNTEKNDVLESMYYALRQQGFRFLMVKEGEPGRFYEQDYNSAISRLRTRMYRRLDNTRVRIEPKSERNEDDVETLEAASSPVVGGESAPEANDVVLPRKDAPKGHLGNSRYFQKLWRCYSEFKVASPAERGEITTKLVDELQREGVRFVFQVNGTWKTLHNEQVLQRVRRNLREICTRDPSKKRVKKMDKADDVEVSNETKDDTTTTTRKTMDEADDVEVSNKTKDDTTMTRRRRERQWTRLMMWKYQTRQRMTRRRRRERQWTRLMMWKYQTRQRMTTDEKDNG